MASYLRAVVLCKRTVPCYTVLAKLINGKHLYRHSFSEWNYFRYTNKGIFVLQFKNSGALLLKFTYETSLFCIEQRITSKGKKTLRNFWPILKVSNPEKSPVQGLY